MLRKAKHVQRHSAERREHYAIFAKSFKARLKEDVLLFDLKDLRRAFE